MNDSIVKFCEKCGHKLDDWDLTERQLCLACARLNGIDY